jgi:CRISPR-associated protein Cmr5
MQTLKQRYLKTALEYIQEVEKKDAKFRENYLSRIRKLPSMITHNGLLTTVTFLYAKSKGKENADGIILLQLVKFLKDSEDVEDEKAFIEKLANIDAKRLMLYSKRALELSQWLKRLAEGTFGEGEGKDAGDK